jgi:hypothetical protein
LAFANTGGIGLYIADYFKCNSKKMELIMYEDGIATYSKIAEDQVNYSIKNPIKQVIKRIVYSINKPALEYVSLLYVYKPEYMEWKPKFEVMSLPPIDKNSDLIRKEYNHIFMYDDKEDKYDGRIIFFEENFLAEGLAINDVDIVQQVESIFGKDNIYIKVHPRNPRNRFREMGYKTNTNVAIPWEVIVLNMNLDEKIFITIGSTAAISPNMLYDASNQVFFLNKCIDKKNEYNDKFRSIFEIIKREKPDLVNIPEDIYQFRKQVEEKCLKK